MLLLLYLDGKSSGSSLGMLHWTRSQTINGITLKLWFGSLYVPPIYQTQGWKVDFRSYHMYLIYPKESHVMQLYYLEYNVLLINPICIYLTVSSLVDVTFCWSIDNLPCHFVSAFGAGFVTTVIASPVDVVKTRYMNSPPGQYKSAINCAWTMMTKEGPTAFYKG